MTREPTNSVNNGYDRTVRIQPETHRALKAYASSRDLPYQEVADSLLREALASAGHRVHEGLAVPA